MKKVMPRSDEIRLVRFSAFLWIGYIIVLAAINQTFPGPQQNNYLYYALLGIVALLCLGLAYWTWIQKELEQAFLPIVITLIVVLPVIISQIAGRLSPLGPRFQTPEGSVLAIFPFLFVALLLVAWKYKWQYILLVIVGIAALNFGMIWSINGPGQPPFMGGFVVALIQTVIFLVVGFSISYLMSRVRTQQQSLEAANVRLSHYASTLEQLATSRERNRLARELHDTLAHTLSGLSVQLETLKAYWDVDQHTARSILDKSLEMAHLGLEETRRAVKALRASPLDDLGLILAVKNLAEDTVARGGLKLDLSEPDSIPALSPDVEQCIYRVAQEAMTNVIKHANAKNLMVKLESTGGKMSLTVADDGIGFHVGKIDHANHFGMAGMQERAQLAGGELTIKSDPVKGTRIQLVI